MEVYHSGGDRNVPAGVLSCWPSPDYAQNPNTLVDLHNLDKGYGEDGGISNYWRPISKLHLGWRRQNCSNGRPKMDKGYILNLQRIGSKECWTRQFHLRYKLANTFLASDKGSDFVYEIVTQIAKESGGAQKF
eukprot:augustus_masked-scaffold_6-processed-gene-15.3-mRNA-1 protein AED:1.00 eAED:1.00 QI:0/0/0/0/1/1/2/0/132